MGLPTKEHTVTKAKHDAGPKRVSDRKFRHPHRLIGKIRHPHRSDRLFYVEDGIFLIGADAIHDKYSI
jgi:hypothetical protein